jgi:hypothetical protein
VYHDGSRLTKDLLGLNPRAPFELDLEVVQQAYRLANQDPQDHAEQGGS